MGSAAAYLGSVSVHTVLLREGMLPISGKAGVAEFVNSNDGKWAWNPKMQGASRAGDFAYVAGSYRGTTKNGDAANGQYVRVWVRDASNSAQARWTIAGDVMTPQPPPPKQ